MTEEGIPYTVRQTIVEVPATVPFKVPISVFMTRVVVYGPFKSMDEGRDFTNYPSSVSWTEDIGAATMARGTLYFASKSVYGGSSAKYSVEIKYEGYLTAQS